MSSETIKDVNIVKSFNGENRCIKEQNKSWKIDKDKIQKIINLVGFLGDATLINLKKSDSNSSNFEKLQEKRNTILQRLTLLSVLQDVQEFRGKYSDTLPYIKVKHEQDGSLDFQFKEFKIDEKMWNPTLMKVDKSHIHISDVNNGVNAMSASLEAGKVAFCGHFGNFDETENAISFGMGEGRSKVIDKGTKEISKNLVKKGSNKALVKAVGLVPFVGDLVSWGIETAIDKSKVKEDCSFMKGEFKSLKAANIYSDFDCSTSIVKYKKGINSKSKQKVYAYEGIDTRDIIKRVNKKTGLQLNIKSIINKPNEVVNDRSKFFGKKNKNDDLYNNAIKYY